MIRIKTAAKSDIPLIHSLAQTAFPATYREILSREQIEYMMEWMYSLQSIEREISSGQVYRIGYEHDNPCAYTEIEKQSDNLFHLQKIYVLPNFQGKGIGKAMFEDAVQYIRGNAQSFPCSMELNVNRNNKALNFYRKMGMKKLRSGDFEIGGGFFMNDFIMGLEIS